MDQRKEFTIKSYFGNFTQADWSNNDLVKGTLLTAHADSLRWGTDMAPLIEEVKLHNPELGAQLEEEFMKKMIEALQEKHHNEPSSEEYDKNFRRFEKKLR